MNRPSREPHDPQDLPEPGEGIGLRPRVALAGYGLLSLVLAVIGFAGLVLPALLDLNLSPPSLLGRNIQIGDVWGVASALAVICGFLGITQTIQEERRGLVFAVLGLSLGVWGLLSFFSRVGWLQIF